MKRAWIAFAATLVLVLPARIYAMLRYLDPQTGFYSDGGKAVGAVSAVLAAGILLTLFYGSRGAVPRTGTEPLRDVPAAASGALAGIFVLVQSVAGLGSVPAGDGLVFYRIFSGAGILAGAVLLTTAYDLAAGQRTVGAHPLFALLPSLWGCLFLVVLFIAYSAVVNLVENVYHTFTVVFLLLFLFTQAKLLTGIESSKSGKMIYMAGLPAALLALSTGVPSCVQYFSAGRTPGAVPVGLHMANIVLAVYIVAFLSALLRPAAAPEQASQPETREAPEEEKPSGAGPLRAEPDDPLAGCVKYLRNALGSEEGFVGSGESPFYSAEDSNSVES